MRIVETLYYFIDVFMRSFMRGEVTDVVPTFLFCSIFGIADREMFPIT